MPRAPTNDVELKVVLARRVSDAQGLHDRPLLAITPDRASFNDYGMKLYANLVYLDEEDRRSNFHLRLMFKGSSHTEAFLRDLFEKSGPIIPIEDVDVPFCSLQTEAIEYRQLVQLMGFDAAVDGLRRIHDVVLANLEQEDARTIALTQTEQFHVGMIRNPSRYTAYRRGNQYLRPQPRQAVEDAATSFTASALLPGTRQPAMVEFNLEPDEIFADRACVLIGRNGVGKTQLLSAIVDGLTNESGGTHRASLSPPPDFSRTIVFSAVPSDPYRKSIPPWLDIDYEYFAIAADPQPLGGRFMQALMDSLRDDGSAIGASGSRRARPALLERAIDKLGFWSRLHVPLRSDVEPTIFNYHVAVDGVNYTSLQQHFNEQQENQLVSAIDMDRPAVVLSDEMAPKRLSSGELAMLQFAAQAVASIENGSLVLLDEPETNLHPNYISQFMDLLQMLLAMTRSVAIIATHSAYVLREVPRQRVNVLSREDVVVFADKPRMQTFGANIDDLSQFVFDDSAVSARFRERLAQWAIEVGSEIGIDGIVERYGDQLSPTTLSLVAQALRERNQG